MAPTKASISGESPSDSWLSSRGFKTIKVVSFTYGLSAVQTAVFVLSPRESEFMWEPFKRLLIYYLKPLFP